MTRHNRNDDDRHPSHERHIHEQSHRFDDSPARDHYGRDVGDRARWGSPSRYREDDDDDRRYFSTPSRYESSLDDGYDRSGRHDAGMPWRDRYPRDRYPQTQNDPRDFDGHNAVSQRPDDRDYERRGFRPDWARDRYDEYGADGYRRMGRDAMERSGSVGNQRYASAGWKSDERIRWDQRDRPASNGHSLFDAEPPYIGVPRLEPGDDRWVQGPHTGHGPKGWQRNDERMREDVCEALEADGAVDARNIDVSVQQGEVTLEGSVPDREQKHRAERCAERCRGIKDVHNRLRVQTQPQQTQGNGSSWSASDSDRPGKSLESRTRS